MSDREGLEKLAPCPFCGVTPTLGVLHRDGGFSPKDGGDVVHHGDDECPAEGFHFLEVWNRRSSPPPADQNKQIAEAHGIDLATLSDPPPPAEPVGLGTFARTAAILAAEPDPGLRIPEAVKKVAEVLTEHWKGSRSQLMLVSRNVVHAILPARTQPQCTCGAKKGEWHKQECAVNTTSPDGNGPAQDGKPFEAEDFKEELGRWKQHKWFWSVIDDLLSKRTPQKPSELWVCSECGKEFDHRPGPHRVKYGGPLCDGTAFEKGSDRWSCDDCMMRDMTEAEGDAHHASTGHSVSSK